MTLVIDIFSVMGTITTSVMLLSPIPTIVDVLKTKQTGVASIVPLVALFTNSYIVMQYGYLRELYFPVFSIGLFGSLIALTYTAIFYQYSHEREKNNKVFVMFGAPLTIITIYSILGGVGITNQNRHDVGRIDGTIGIAATVILYSSPFEKIRMVLRHKSAVFINIHMVCAGVINNSMWVVYGILIGEWVIYAPNIFTCCASCSQIVLYLIYHPRRHPYSPPADSETLQESDIEAATKGSSTEPLSTPTVVFHKDMY